MKPSKRIWELQPSTVCTVVGMALHPEELREIALRYGISVNDPLMDEELVIQTMIVRSCGRDNRVSRRTEELIERRFAVYGEKIPLEDLLQLIHMVRKKPHDLQVPPWAILWGPATRGPFAEVKIETLLFGFVTMMEHRLFRNYWKSLYSAGNGNNGRVDTDSEVFSLRKDLIDLQWANASMEKLIVDLRYQAETAASEREAQESVSDPDISVSHNCRCAKSRKIRDLNALLDQAKYCNYELEVENAQLKEEITSLIGELRLNEEASGRTGPSPPDRERPYGDRLTGKKITLVGGIQSLECHYRHLIESSGGRFCRHDGNCCGGDEALHDSISGSDLVVCPLVEDGHPAVKSVKKICKARGVRCCFPRSASITGLRKALQEHYADLRVA